MRFKTLQRQKRQQGLALIMAIGFLGLLSILGAVVMNMSMRDLKNSTTTLPNQRSLYAADAAVEYALNRDMMVNLGQFNSVSLTADHVIQANGLEVPGNITHKAVIDRAAAAAGGGELVAGTFTDIGPRDLPPVMASMFGSEFGANMYHVNVKTEAKILGSNVETTHIDASIVRLFKMDDDQIFRTFGK